VSVSGELDLKNGWAQLATARYAAESVSAGAPSTPRPDSAETLTVLTTLAEVRRAVNDIAATAQRLISIYTPDLEPDLYDQSAFLEVIKHFVLTRSFSKVRVLLAEPTRVMHDSNRFVAMGQSQQRASAYLIADDRAIVYRLRADSWDGVADINNPQAARQYLQEFDQVWNASAAEHGLRATRRG
jgi:hypothetical protein